MYPREMFEIDKKIRSMPAQRCSFVDARGIRCKQDGISSHTVQHGAGLKDIVENGHVFELGVSKFSTKTTKITPINKVSAKKASMFSGFCAKHDFEVFLPIERGDIKFSARNALLFSYRAVCHELFKKTRAIQMFKLVRENPEIKLPKGYERFIDTLIDDMVLASRDLKSLKSDTEARLHGRMAELKNMSVVMAEFNGVLPVVASGVFTPEFNWDRTRLLNSRINQAKRGTAFLHFGRSGNTNLAVLAAVKQNNAYPVLNFLEQFNNLTIDEMGSRFQCLALGHLENAFARISWYDQLSPNDQQRLSNSILSGLQEPASPDDLWNDPYFPMTIRKKVFLSETE